MMDTYGKSPMSEAIAVASGLAAMIKEWERDVLKCKPYSDKDLAAYMETR